MRTLKVGGLVFLAVLASAVGFRACRPTPSSTVSILKPQDKEALSYNSNTHVLTVATSSGTKTEYTRNPVIHFQKDGTVKIDRKLYAWEFNPFIGTGYGDATRLHLGASVFYVWRLDVNAQLAFNGAVPGAIVPIVSVSYNVWRNSNAFLGVDPFKKQYHAGLFVRF